MFLTLANAPWIFLAGAATGIVGAMLGTGGGVFLIPLLVLVWDLPMHHAVATSIVSVVATSTAVASTNVERGTANMRLGMTLEMATALGAITGALTAGWLSPTVLEGVFGVILVPTAILILRGKTENSATNDAAGSGNATPDNAPMIADLGRLGGQFFDEASGTMVAYRVRRLWAGLCISLLAGNLSGLLGIGGGVFKLPALNLACGVPIKAAAATSNFMIGVTAATSAFMYFGLGSVRPALTAVVVLGVVCGSAAGMLVNRKVSGRTVQILFAVLLFGVAAEMMFRALKG